MTIAGDVVEREFFHWTTPEFLKAANNAATVEVTTTPTTSWYWRNKLASRSWTPRPPVDLGEIGELLAHGKYTSELFKEYVFEEVRVVEFGSRPTRRRAMFLFDSSLDPREYASALKLSMTHPHLYRVTVRAGRLHRAALGALDCNYSLHADMVAKAREYWSHVSLPSLATEILFEGECTMQYVVTT